LQVDRPGLKGPQYEYLGASFYNIVLQKHGGLLQCLVMPCHINWYIVSRAGEA